MFTFSAFASISALCGRGRLASLALGMSLIYGWIFCHTIGYPRIEGVWRFHYVNVKGIGGRLKWIGGLLVLSVLFRLRMLAYMVGECNRADHCSCFY